MADIQFSGQGDASVQVDAAGTVGGAPVLAGPKTAQDSISSSGGTGAKKGYSAALTPELIQALYILYYSGNTGPQLVQVMMGGKQDAVDPAVFKMNVETKLNQICINMLNAWGKSVADEGKRMREIEKSQAYQEWRNMHGSNGYEAWLQTLGPDQRLRIMEFPNFDRKVDLNAATHSMLTSYVQHLHSNPSSTDNLPFMSSAITLGLSTQFDYAALPTVQAGQIGINPIRDASSAVMQNAGPRAAELGGYLGGIIVQAASLGAVAQALTIPAKAAHEVVDKQFAQAFARNVLDEVSGPGFSALASGLYAAEAQKPGSLSQERFTGLLQASLLSTAFSLLYATEPSINVTVGGQKVVFGRTMNALDFKALASNEVDLSNASKQMQQLYAATTSAIDGLGADKSTFIAAFAGFVDKNKDYDTWSQLRHIRGLLNPGEVSPLITA